MKLRLNKKRSGRRGYTLLEIMFSILILGVGMAAVASLFPFATHIQQNTMHELMSQQTRSNIVTLLVNKGMDKTVINDSTKHEVPAGMTYQTNTTRLALAAGALVAAMAPGVASATHGGKHVAFVVGAGLG